MTWRSWFFHVEDQLAGELFGVLGLREQVVEIGAKEGGNAFEEAHGGSFPCGVDGLGLPAAAEQEAVEGDEREDGEEASAEAVTAMAEAAVRAEEQAGDEGGGL